jgi:hypothetical protein
MGVEGRMAGSEGLRKWCRILGIEGSGVGLEGWRKRCLIGGMEEAVFDWRDGGSGAVFEVHM